MCEKRKDAIASPCKRGAENESSSETIYYRLADMKELPAGISWNVNPRRPKMTRNAAKSLLNAAAKATAGFYISNRGIVISAKSLSFNSNHSEVTIDIGDQDDETDRHLYGILDGGHTYTAIMMKRDGIPEDTHKFVRVEVITNVQTVTRLSDARNTSLQVSGMALFNCERSNSRSTLRRSDCIQEQ